MANLFTFCLFGSTLISAFKDGTLDHSSPVKLLDDVRKKKIPGKIAIHFFKTEKEVNAYLDGARKGINENRPKTAAQWLAYDLGENNAQGWDGVLVVDCFSDKDVAPFKGDPYPYHLESKAPASLVYAIKTYPCDVFPGTEGDSLRAACVVGYEGAAKALGWHSVEESLPPIEQEVIVLADEIHGNKLPEASYLCFGHRPNPDGWTGRDIFTGKVTHHIPQTYDGWNIPGVRFWMPLPKLPEPK